MAKLGADTKYREEYIDQIIEFFDIDPWVEEDGRRIPNKLPTIEKFCTMIGITRKTLHNWTKVNPDFMEAYQIAKQMQKDILNQNGLAGLYNPSYCKFVAINETGMADRKETAVEGKLSLENLINESFKDE